MGNRKKYMSAAFTGVAAMGAVGITAGHARAASTPGVWHVTPPNTNIAASNTTSTDLKANGTTVLTCAPAHGALSGITGAASITGTPATLVGGVAGAFSSCKSPGGQTYNASVTQGSLVGNTYSAGVTTGALQNIKAKVTGPGACTISLSGSVPGTFANTHTLTANGAVSNLHITKRSGTFCSLLVASNEPAGFSGTFATSQPVSITGTPS